MRVKTPDFKTRLKKIREKTRRMRLGAFLLTAEADIRYATGFYMSGARLFVPVNGEVIYLIDRMNETLAKDSLTGRGVMRVLAGRVTDLISQVISKSKIKSIGIDDENISAAGMTRFKNGIKGVKIAGVPSLIRDIREIKDREEIYALREAAKETVSIWESVKKGIRSGMTEKLIAMMLDVEMRKRGYENSFPTIVAIGKNSAHPHALPGEARFKKGEILLADFGIRFSGYCSDLTRVYYEGTINPQIAVFHKLVCQASDFAIKNIRPGAKMGAMVEDVNRIFEKNGLGNLVLHGLGHGVGLDIHEKPSLYSKNPGRFSKGMVVTVEPGLYKAGLGGIRIENMVLVTANGCEVLTK